MGFGYSGFLVNDKGRYHSLNNRPGGIFAAELPFLYYTVRIHTRSEETLYFRGLKLPSQQILN
jgi:hypothetical protein